MPYVYNIASKKFKSSIDGSIGLLGLTAGIRKLSEDPKTRNHNFYFYPSAWVDQRKKQDYTVVKAQP